MIGVAGVHEAFPLNSSRYPLPGTELEMNQAEYPSTSVFWVCSIADMLDGMANTPVAKAMVRTAEAEKCMLLN